MNWTLKQGRYVYITCTPLPRSVGSSYLSKTTSFRLALRETVRQLLLVEYRSVQLLCNLIGGKQFTAGLNEGQVEVQRAIGRQHTEKLLRTSERNNVVPSDSSLLRKSWRSNMFPPLLLGAGFRSILFLGVTGGVLRTREARFSSMTLLCECVCVCVCVCV